MQAITLDEVAFNKLLITRHLRHFARIPDLRVEAVG